MTDHAEPGLSHFSDDETLQLFDSGMRFRPSDEELLEGFPILPRPLFVNRELGVLECERDSRYIREAIAILNHPNFLEIIQQSSQPSQETSQHSETAKLHPQGFVVRSATITSTKN